MACGEIQLSRIYLVRHGQAGTRTDYDALSGLGREQARLLGAYFASQPIEFVAAFSGTLTRQEQTAVQVKESYEAAGRRFPNLVPDCGWNEFDLNDVYLALAPRMCAEDSAFRKEYEELERQARAKAHQPEAEVHRRWMPSDVRLVEAWVAGRYPYQGESWPAFRERVLACRSRLVPFARDENIVVFTSAVPIGIWTAHAVETGEAQAWRLAGSLLNTACTVIRLGDSARLHSFNVVAHLRPELHSYR